MSKWQKIDSEIKYKNPWYQVREDKVIRPDGKEGTYSTIEYHKHGIQVIPIENNGVYLIENFRYPLQTYFLEFIVGGLGNHYTSLDAAKAELEEETGFKANKWTQLPKIYLLPPICNLEDDVFIAEELIKGERHLDGNEDIKAPRWYSFNELEELVQNGKISSTATLAGILKAKLYLGL